MTGDAQAARGLPVAVVPHGYRSVPILQVAAAASGICRIVWLVDGDDPEVRASRRLLGRIGPVVDVGGLGPDGVAKALEPYAPSGIVALRDDDLVLVADVAARLGLRFHTPDVAWTLADKLAQRRALARGGLPMPAVWELDDPGDARRVAEVAAAARFPAVCKPRRGSGSRHTFPVHNAAELAGGLGAFSRRAACTGAGTRTAPVLGPMILEEYLPSAPGEADSPFADYVSVESLATGDGLVHVAVTGRTRPTAPFRETGFFLPSNLDPAASASVLDTATAALEALGVREGCTHTEVKLTPDGPRVIEVNGRLGGGIRDLLLAASGRDLLAGLFQSCLGQPVGIGGMVTCQRIGFRLFYQPPLDARRVVAIDGLRELSEVPGVEDVDLHHGPGSEIDPREGTRAFLCSVVGAVDDHAAVAALNCQMYEMVDVDYVTSARPVAVGA